MDTLAHVAIIALYRKLICESEPDPWCDGDRHRMLVTLLGEEVAKDNKPPDVRVSVPTMAPHNSSRAVVNYLIERRMVRAACNGSDVRRSLCSTRFV
jgi:hypothetical protein